MTTFTRLTVLGTVRRAELVVPDDASIGGLLPRLMELLEEPAGTTSRPLTLVRTTGEQVDAALSAAEQSLADGEQLRLVRADDVPAPPEVADVTDVIGDSYAARPGRWSDRTREATGAVAVGSLACVALLLARPTGPALPAAALVLLAVAAAACGRTPGLPAVARRWGAIALTAAAAGLGAPTARLLPGLPGVPRVALVSAATVALVWLALAAGVGVGLRSRPALAGALVGVALVLAPVLAVVAGLAPVHAVALDALAAVVTCGLLPWFALSSSGLTGLDDQVLAGRPGRRDRVLRTVDDAYRSLSWATVAVALPLAGAGAVLVLAPGRWTLVLGLVVALVTALRSRAFPLAAQQMPLWFAALAVMTTALVGARDGLGARTTALALVALVALVAVLVGARPPAHVRAALRRAGNLVEALAVIAMVPLLLGTFGVLADLLRTFR